MKEIDLRLITDYEDAIQKVEETKAFLQTILEEDDLTIVFDILDNFSEISKEKIKAIKNFYKK